MIYLTLVARLFFISANSDSNFLFSSTFCCICISSIIIYNKTSLFTHNYNAYYNKYYYQLLSVNNDEVVRTLDFKPKALHRCQFNPVRKDMKASVVLNYISDSVVYGCS